MYPLSLKVGDFGLATSSLAAVDPSDLSPQVSQSDSDLTLGKLDIVDGYILRDLTPIQRWERNCTLPQRFHRG